MGKSINIDASVDSAIQSTERYYREQIFSSGCSSLVPIYRIVNHTNRVDMLVQQLNGSPYIQKNIEFSEKVIETLLDVDLYKHEEWHFFFQGDMSAEMQAFVEEHCQQVTLISQVAQHDYSGEQPKWARVNEQLETLVETYPIIANLDLSNILEHLSRILSRIKFHNSLESLLDLLYQPEWAHKIKLDQSVLICMLAVARQLGWADEKTQSLITLGLLKDLGYTRLNEQIDNFEILHPVITHKLIGECNALAGDELCIADDIAAAVLVHHEFTDSSGPLARMKHPLVTRLINESIPEIAQISGMCDLYFGFLKDYSPGVAFAITCGFVLGQGDVKARYNPDIINAFSAVIKQASCEKFEIADDEANALITSILNLLKDKKVRANIAGMIENKTSSWYDRITLALNVVRNIARLQPKHLGEESLVNILHLPEEFGLNY